MEQYPQFKREMIKTHTILMPQMCALHFSMIRDLLIAQGYKVELLTNDGPQVAQEGLKYVHNDTCYPALLVIGQMIDALKSGKYDLDHTALIITQTGGGCRASNYIHLLRRALKNAGLGQVPVASLNFSGLEKDSGFQLTPKLMLQLVTAVYYGDLLMLLRNQTAPYEKEKGACDALCDKWTALLAGQMARMRGLFPFGMNKNFRAIAADFAAVPVDRSPRVKAGVVGEIYVKYAPLGNNNLQAFLESEGCEVNMPGLMGFLLYCVCNGFIDVKLYGGKRAKAAAMRFAAGALSRAEEKMHAIARSYGFHAPKSFSHTRELGRKVIGEGSKMGEGWLLPAEMMELCDSGYENIVCAQPFGCLPNHIVGKGMVSKIRHFYPDSNIVAIDYDPGATRVNQENRIKLMLAVAREKLEGRAETAPASEPAQDESRDKAHAAG